MINEKKWMEMYNLAKAYYEHYGNLNIPTNFKTKNGYEYDNDGVNLGRWIIKQKRAFDGKKYCNIGSKQIKLLNDIDICWENMQQWMKKYSLAEAYYKHFSNLEIRTEFRTSNGYEYDDDGVKLGLWFQNQQYLFKTGCMSIEQIELLEMIGAKWKNPKNFNNWMKKYAIIKSYYDHYGNLKIPKLFKTKNGYEYDKDGINPNSWLNTQKQVFNGKKNYQMPCERIKLLDNINTEWFINNSNTRIQIKDFNIENSKSKRLVF